MRIASKSDVGKKRKNNQDSIKVNEDQSIFLLADGMGGHQGGEVASKIAVEKALSRITEGINASHDDKDIAKLLLESLFDAHDDVKERAKSDLNLSNMGTTLVQMILKNDKAYICNVGDSRAYLMRDDIQQLTKDQTVADYLLEHNIMSREDIPTQKWHTLTQAVGLGENIVPEQLNIDINQGDFFLLCSDGLTDMLTDEEIKETIKKYGDNIEKAADGLIKRANKKGGRDNISVILVKYDEQN